METQLLLLLILLLLSRADTLSNSSEERRVLPRPRYADGFVARFKDLDGLLHDIRDDDDNEADKKEENSVALRWAFRPGNGKPSGFDFEDNTVGSVDAIQATKSSAKPTASTFMSPELTLNHKHGGDLTNAGVEDDLASSIAEEGFNIWSGIRLEVDEGGVLAVKMPPGGPKWANWPEDWWPRIRRRRSWLWNQFFVIEEYRGPEPVLIGRVSSCLCCRFL